MPLSPAEHAEVREYFHQRVGPLLRTVMGTETDQSLQYDQEVWECFIEALSVDIARDILWGPETRGPHCAECDAEGDAGEFDADHEFTPRDKTGSPPCLCGHKSNYHLKGERGQDHPQYWAVEGFQRIALKDPKNPGETPMALDPKYVRGLWTLLLDFDKHRDAAVKRFKVLRPTDALPG